MSKSGFFGTTGDVRHIGRLVHLTDRLCVVEAPAPAGCPARDYFVYHHLDLVVRVHTPAPLAAEDFAPSSPHTRGGFYATAELIERAVRAYIKSQRDSLVEMILAHPPIVLTDPSLLVIEVGQLGLVWMVCFPADSFDP